MPRKSSFSGTDVGDPLSRRERQIMDIIYAAGSATAREIHEQMIDPPTYATVRTILRVLLEKNQLKHRQEGKSYIYSPVNPREVVAESAMKRLVRTFYDGSVEQAVSGLLGLDDKKLDIAELERIKEMIEHAERKARKK